MAPQQAIERICSLGLPTGELFARVIDELRMAVPFDGACWHTHDPATSLITAAAYESLPDDGFIESVEHELWSDDPDRWTPLMRRDPPVVVRERGKEVRAGFVSEGAGWGGLALMRDAGRRDFDDREATLLASLSDTVASGLRAAVAAAPREREEGGPGVIVLDAHNQIEAADERARELLVQLADQIEPLPGAAYVVAMRARAGGGPPRVRVRTFEGRWLTLYASLIDDSAAGRVALVVEPSAPAELADVIVLAYGLSQREREVVAAVARGESTNEIAQRLFISPWTVQDHLKAIFEKMSVRSRREMVARLYAG